jgi:Domain of unknown function (DUF5655)
MATDYGEKERAFIDGLKEATGRDLAAWMTAISAQNLAHRNDIIYWLRQQGFMFSKASWLERIHHNGGKPIYAGTANKVRVRVHRPRSDAGETQQPAQAASLQPANDPAPAAMEAPAATAAAAPAAAPSPDTGLAELLARAKAYRPLAQAVITRIKSVCPAARFEPRDTFVAISDPQAFAALGIGPKELRLHLALGEHPTDDVLKKGAPGGGLGREDALSHMVVLTDARQIDQRLLDLVRRAATNVNG